MLKLLFSLNTLNKNKLNDLLNISEDVDYLDVLSDENTDLDTETNFDTDTELETDIEDNSNKKKILKINKILEYNI